MQKWTQAINTLTVTLEKTRCTTARETEISSADAFRTWHASALSIRSQKKSIFLIGNGASASMASHFAADLAKNAHIRATVFTDLSQITAVGNDTGFENIYATPLQCHAQPEDMLVAISSSGASPNILKAAETAQKLGLFLVTLSGFDPDNPLSRMGALNFYTPAASYGLVETSHAAILHFWMDLVTEKT